MSDYVCPLCGGKVVKKEVFCRSCQQIAKRSNPDKFVSRPTSTQKPVVEEIELEPEIIAALDNEYIPPNEAPKVKGSRKKLVLVLTALLIVAVVCGTYYYFHNRNLETEKAYWMECVDGNTPLGYADYLKKYPEGTFSVTAEEKLRELKELELVGWNELRNSNDINLHFTYLQEYPNTPYASEVKNRIDRLAWQAALKENSADIYSAYINNVELGNYAGAYIDVAKERYTYQSSLTTLEDAEQNTVLVQMEKILKAIEARDVKQLKGFLSDKPSLYLGIVELDKKQLLDSLSNSYKSVNNPPTIHYQIIKAQTTIIKDMYDMHAVTTSVVRKTTTKEKRTKSKIDTLNMAMQLDKALKIERIEIIERSL